MITDAANNFAAAILQRADQFDQTARMYAVQYASTDEPRNKAEFEKNSDLANLLRKLHGETCSALHAVEAEMRAKATGSTT